MESKLGQMALDIRVSGERTKLMEKENFGMWMVIYTMENGKMTKLTDMACTFTLMEQNMMVSGIRIYKMDMELNNGPMDLNMKDSINRDKSMAKVRILGQMEVSILDSGMIIKFQG